MWNKAETQDESSISIVTRLQWSAITTTLAVCSEKFVTILLEQPILSQMKQNTAVVQLDYKNFLLVQLENHMLSQLSLQIQVVFYEIVNNGKYTSTKIIANFPCVVVAAAVVGQSIVCMEKDQLSLRTFQGTSKQVIALPEMEGTIIVSDVSTPWMCLGTSGGFMRVYEVNDK
ncbi:unnamed protein product [Enterobius vermicularis]|uniref:Nucleoporin_N domain-containing protein n=1 Tax=Enterobius vermicularis TaxID=51028 RepID=A0A0N4UZU5_ENTVE|nr:unnamed protein product [Enterobius vermicularis]